MRILNVTPLVFLNLFHRSLSTTIIRTLLLCILAYDAPQMNQTNNSYTIGFVLGLVSQLVSKCCWCIVRGVQTVTQGRKDIEGSIKRTKTTAVLQPHDCKIAASHCQFQRQSTIVFQAWLAASVDLFLFALHSFCVDNSTSKHDVHRDLQ